MRVLITGATGGLGQNLAQYLRDHGYQCHLTGRNQSALQKLQAQGFKTYYADLTQDPLTDLMSGIDKVIHCAALSSPWGAPEAFQQANVVATQRLLQAAIAVGVQRFVHVSSPSVQFAFQDQYNLRESDPLPPPVNNYALTKALAEKEVLAAGNQIQTLGIRPRAIYGPHDTTLLPRILRLAQKGTVPLFRKGTQLVDLCSARNACESLRLCLEAPTQALGKFYNITNDHPLALREALEDVFGALDLEVKFRNLPLGPMMLLARGLEAWSRYKDGPEPILTRYGLGVLSYGQTLDLQLAKTHLGYTPVQDWSESLIEFASWWHQDAH